MEHVVAASDQYYSAQFNLRESVQVFYDQPSFSLSHIMLRFYKPSVSLYEHNLVNNDKTMKFQQ